MKVLIIMHQPFDPTSGGVQMTTYKMGSYFYKAKIDINYFSLSKKGHKQQYPGKQAAVSNNNLDKNSKNLEELRKFIDENKPEIIINQSPYLHNLRRFLFDLQSERGFKLISCLRNTPLRYINNVKSIISRQTPDFLKPILLSPAIIGLFKKRHKFLHAKVIKDILDKNDYYVLLGPQNREELEYFIGEYKFDKLKVIPNSIPGVYEDVSEKQKILLYVGGISIAHKRSDLLLHVWKKIYHKLPDWQFVIVGDGTYLNELRKIIINSNIPRVEAKGRQVPNEYYEKASLFIMVSEKEGFPNVLVEAQSFGVVPVVFNSYGVLSWITNNKKDAVLIDPFNVDQMAEQIVSLADDPIMLKNMQKAALENARRFTIDRVGKMWIEFFNEIRG